MILINRNGHDGRYKKIKQLVKEDSILQFYQNQGILDVYPYCLSEEEAREIIVIYDYHLKHEHKFLSFFQDMFAKHACTVHFREPIKKLNKEERERLGSVNFKTYKKLRKYKPGCAIVEIVEELLLLAKLSALEICFVDYIFDDGVVIVQGNYDLSFPIFYQHPEVTKIVSKSGLFIRS
ncbi:hypothetical protein [Paenibacillus sp. Marseille-Q4541]|uniref:hypothetical protein n=1 Tax=Paenibacillus sp. Marseille-Q4541 TaxID=2831522 RepID=UPI001BADCC64|nr:hypothetical protein [Paenibacillus sp. Marseille-Q4541]